jgi:protein disulfide-isomerase A1
MRTAAIAGALFAAVAAASDVHDLKKDTFDAFVKENDLVLAECK